MNSFSIEKKLNENKMKTSLKIVLVFTIFSSIVFAQTIYELPFASKDNSFEIVVENTSAEKEFTGEVNITKYPSWLQFKNKNQVVEYLPAGEELSTVFDFDVSDEAPVTSEEEVIFVVKEKTGDSWQKIIKITVLPPESFELFQNYPNPFNPITVISYQLLVESKVSLRIYNVLGEEVTELVNKVENPGKYKVEWNASSYASGMYVYQIFAEGLNGEKNIVRKKMLLVK